MKTCIFLILFALGFILGTKNEHALKWIEKKFSLFSEKKDFNSLYPVTEHKAFVFIVPSYNNSEWVEKNLRSIFEQKYDNFRVIYIDDASNDRTLSRALNLIAQYRQEHRVQVWHNDANCGAVENIYRAGHSCTEQEIIIICDGDDWLAHEHVLQILNEKYADPSVWGTYGSYIEYPAYSYTVANFALHLPQKIIVENKVREFSKKSWCLSHLRTFYAALFKKVKLEDIVYEGKYYPAAADVAFMIPIAEMAGEHLRFVEEILYIYNRASVLNDHKVHAERQRCVTEHILNLSPYSPIASPFSVASELTVHLIVFSFDRPMQLYALLESLDRYAKNLDETTVIYRSSSVDYERGYDQVKGDFPRVHFLSQSERASEDFKPLLMKVLNECPEEYMTCAVDDIILIDEIDFHQGAENLKKVGAHCFCYRLGQEIDYCYMQNMQQGIPPLVPVDPETFAWKFDEGKGDWSYKNSLDLTLYKKEEVMKQWKALCFTHPNSLESAWVLKAKKGGVGLCSANAKMVNIPLNLVQISSNRHMNRYSVEELLSKFHQGFKIDIASLYQIKNHSAHIEYDVQFVVRNQKK